MRTPINGAREQLSFSHTPLLTGTQLSLSTHSRDIGLPGPHLRYHTHRGDWPPQSAPTLTHTRFRLTQPLKSHSNPPLRRAIDHPSPHSSCPIHLSSSTISSHLFFIQYSSPISTHLTSQGDCNISHAISAVAGRMHPYVGHLLTWGERFTS